MICLSLPSRTAMLISEWISTVTSSSLEVPHSTQVSQTDLRLRLIRNAHNKEVLRSLHLKTDTTPCGLVVPPSHLSQPSRASGSPKKSTKRMVLKSFTENVCENKYTIDLSKIPLSPRREVSLFEAI